MQKKSKKFTFSYFKKIRNLDDMNAYIAARLPLLGTGSSRKVYGYSSGKVIKIAINDSGLLQNAAELETYTNPKTKKVVTKIYSYGLDVEDSTKVSWLLSEVAQPIRTKNSFANLSGGLDWDLYQELITLHGKCLLHPGDDNVTNEVEEKLEKQFDERVNYFNVIGAMEDVEWYLEQKKKLALLLKADLYSGVVQCMQSSELMPGDILEIDHYGKTVDGKLVLLDYGLTKSVANKIFPDSQPSHDPKKANRSKTILPPAGDVDDTQSDVGSNKTKKLPRVVGFSNKKRAV